MSSAFYPLGMKSYNNYLPQGGYQSWKGNGINSNPTSITGGSIRPFTNKDVTNNFQTGFGLPRPIKHFRKGKVIPILTVDPNNPNVYIESTNRIVKSSTQGNLVKQLIDIPGGFVVKQNTLTSYDIENNCNNCNGIGLVTNYYPNNSYLTENPTTNSTVYPLCCNAEQKARRRVLPASTNLSKKYYTTHQQYRENRCQTYDQRAFNFQTNLTPDNANCKPGDPRSLSNTYVANCYPSTDSLVTKPNNSNGCKLVIYKPNNPQFAQQGAVTSSTRMLKLNVETIQSNLSNIKNQNTYILKNKFTTCNPRLFKKNGDHTTCYNIN